MSADNAISNDILLLERFSQADASSNSLVDLSGETPVSLTYGQLDELSNRAAKGLLNLGVKPGENVAYLLPNGWEFAALTLAIWKIGAIACPMLPALREREIPFIMQRSKSRVLIIPAEFRKFQYGPLIERVRPEMPGLETLVTIVSRDPADWQNCLGGLAANEPDMAEIRPLAPTADSVAQLLFTSGTTGEPKGVLHTHGTLAHGVFAHVRGLQLTSRDVIWTPSPMAHQTGFLYGMSMAFFLGAKEVLQAVWDVETARIAIEEYGVTFVQVAMPFLADLTRMENPPRGLRIFVATGAAVPRQLAYEASHKLECKVVGGWGSTESCMITVGSTSNYSEQSWNSDGKLIEGHEMKIVDEHGNTVPPGVEGLFKVKTKAMFIGYLDHPEWYENAIDKDGFFDTGDLAVIDEHGNLRLTGRVKDIVNRGGVKIPVVELENLLYQHPTLRDIAIIGMPDPRLGERICAYVSLHQSEARKA